MEPKSSPPPDRAARTLPPLALAVGPLLVLTLGELLQVQDGAAVLLSTSEPYEVIGGPWR